MLGRSLATQAFERGDLSTLYGYLAFGAGGQVPTA